MAIAELIGHTSPDSRTADRNFNEFWKGCVKTYQSTLQVVEIELRRTPLTASQAIEYDQIKAATSN